MRLSLGFGFGSGSTLPAAVEPVAGYIQLVDATNSAGISWTDGGAIGNRFVDSLTPASGTYLDPYTSTLTTRPIYEPGGFNGFASICGDGANDTLDSTTSLFAAAAMNGINTPFVCYISCQFLAATDEVIFSFGNSGGTASWFEFIAATTGNVRKAFRVDGSSNIAATSATSSTNDALRATWRLAFDGTTGTIERDGVQVMSGTFTCAAAFASNCDSFFCLRRSTKTNFGFARFQRRLWYAKASETAGEKTQNYAYMQAGYTPAPGKSLLINEGDSTSQLRDGAQAAWPGSWAGLLTLSNAVISNTAVSSQPLSPNMLTDVVRDVNSNYASGYTYEAAILVAGLNDYNASRTGAQFATDVQTWITSVKAANPSRKVIICTTPKGALITSTKETERQAGNTSIVSNAVSSWGAHAVVDVDGLLPEATSDTSVRNDGTHWTTLACQRVATAVQSVLSGFGFT